MTQPSLFTLTEAIDRFLGGLKNPKTAATYRCGLKALVQYLTGDDPEVEIQTLELDDGVLEGFYYWLDDPERDEPYSAQSVRTYLAAAHRFLRWMDIHDLLAQDYQLTKAEHRLKEARSGRKASAYTHRRIDPEVAAIVPYYDELELPPGDTWRQRQQRLILLRNRAIVHTLYASAGRVSEVASLTRDMVFGGRAEEVQIVGKGDQTRVILLTDEAKDAIRTYLQERRDSDPALFISHGRQGQGKSAALSTHSIWQLVKDAALALGLHETTSPHSFRHSRATQLLNEGMPLESVQAYLGHQDIGTTRKVYAHTRTAVLRDQLATFGLSAREALNKGG